MDHIQTQAFNLLKNNRQVFARSCVKIRDKAGQHQPFEFNSAQQLLDAHLDELHQKRTYVRAVVVKGRQMGCSTYIGLRYFHKALFELGRAIFILTHHTDSTQSLFNMVREFYHSLPDPLKAAFPLGTSNRKELLFDVQRSSYHVGTAGTGAVGRGTTIQLFHGSEVGFWPNTDEITTGILNAVGDLPGTEVILESTANGVGNYFHNAALAGLKPDSKFSTIFLPWYMMPEYQAVIPSGVTLHLTSEEEELQHMYKLSNEQILWRRQKINDEYEGRVWKFQQEYPFTLSEAFVSSADGLFDTRSLQAARKRQVQDDLAPVVMGVDPARKHDRVCFYIRQGRRHRLFKSYKGGTLTEPDIAALCAEYIERYNIDQTFIDTSNNHGVFDILAQLGYKRRITPVHFGQRSLLPDIYTNKRAEMADSAAKYIATNQVSLPDDDELITDLLAIPDIKKSLATMKKQLPSKDDIKKALGGMSPDGFDAFILTFAFPVASKRIQEMTQNSPLQKIIKKSQQVRNPHRANLRKIMS